MMRSGVSAAFAATLISATPAAADGYYLKAFGGASMLGDSDLSITGVGSEADLGFSSGVLAGAAVGYAYPGRNVAAEIEWAYRSGDSDDGSLAEGGDLASTALMLNGIWTLGSAGALQPYLGAGIGYITEVDFDVPSGTAAGEYSDRGGFAFQLIGGASYPISERASVFGEIRYFDAGSLSLSSDTATLDVDYSTLDLGFGLTFNF